VQVALLNSISPQHLLDVLGVAGVLLILFSETGLLVGFFLPGDTLLFSAGAATVSPNQLHLHLPLGWLLIAGVAGAIIGAQTGFEIGRRAGPPLFRRPNSRIFNPHYVERTNRLLERFGPRRAVVLARFVPVIRTFMNPMCGVVGMPARDFTIANVVGGIVWPVLLILVGHAFGHVAILRDHIEEFVLLGFLAAVLPVAFEIARRGSQGARSRRSAK
jgi:membrane-associated protein